MTLLEAVYLFFKILATFLSLWFSGRKVYRWIRKRSKQKPTAKG
ncbi:hypothetical protein ACFOQM_03820 [Paenibacillus sp. GCM10012307]|nr:hypothetical protein [Paenibacillus roseus]